MRRLTTLLAAAGIALGVTAAPKCDWREVIEQTGVISGKVAIKNHEGMGYTGSCVVESEEFPQYGDQCHPDGTYRLLLPLNEKLQMTASAPGHTAYIDKVLWVWYSKDTKDVLLTEKDDRQVVNFCLTEYIVEAP